ncbi:RNA polymerase factor sigma-54 [Paremcibacter congregatus]|uniref:RNA polymerase factor sigma-54 n=1 Tax=Paremcibacter congregatus TaxID=2043170 RepID=UPI0030EB329B|tara:strand:- start:5698 stop:7227 length:1530 start_codon:yes stop_codon:yes gene_type:complete
MALSPRIELKLSQSLVMTPQLQQAIKLLQYSNIDLVDFVAQEIEKNPLLEVGDTSPSSAAEDINGAKTKEGSEATSDDYLTNPGAENLNSEAALDTSFDNDYTNDCINDGVQKSPTDNDMGLTSSSMIGNGGSSFDQAGSGFDLRLSEEISLSDHLLDQLNLLALDHHDKSIIRFLVGMLDDAGYLSESTADIAERFNCDVAEIEKLLDVAQSLEPVGVFARDLSECLKLQQKANDRLDPAMEALLDNLERLAKRDYNGLMRICGVDEEDLRDMISEIQALNPKPGQIFGNPVSQSVIPDVFIRKNPKGNWIVELNSETLPRVLFNNHYFTEIQDLTKKKEDKEYLAECAASASWLVKALDQRARTILKVSSELVKHQELFFEKGVKYLKPLNLKTIADAIEMHESTVSRVTSNKFISTNRGIFELKYFFTTAISSVEGGESHSSESVKHALQSLIDDEDPKKILSDDKLVEILKSQGIDIARRTVAKYREALHIPSSIQRRRIKNAAF